MTYTAPAVAALPCQGCQRASSQARFARAPTPVEQALFGVDSITVTVPAALQVARRASRHFRGAFRAAHDPLLQGTGPDGADRGWLSSPPDNVIAITPDPVTSTARATAEAIDSDPVAPLLPA